MKNNQEHIYRIAYEYPITGRRGRATICARPHEILPYAANYVKFFCKGYLLSIVEDGPAQINNILQLS